MLLAGEEGRVVVRAGQWLRLGILALPVIAGLAGCQAGPRPRSSILDECNHPTEANRDWCLSTKFPSIR